MADCNTAIDATLGVEGIWSDVAADHGGPTKYGITWRTLRTAITAGVVPEMDIKDLTISHARIIYKHFFWNPLRLDEVVSQRVANEMFDTAVNMGIGRSAQITQRAIKLWYREVEVDGIVGAQTLSKINGVPESILFKILNILQGYRYIEICERDISQMVFMKGWINNRVKL